MWLVFTVSLATALPWTLAQSFGADRYFYNNRYSGDGLWFHDEDAEGLYAEEQKYMDPLPENGTIIKPEMYGCRPAVVNGTKTLICNGYEIFIQIYSFTNFTKKMIRNRLTTSLIVKHCPGFTLLEDDALEHLRDLQYLKFQETGLNHVPNMTATRIARLNLAGNNIKMDTNNYRGFPLPSTITNLHLANNAIHWIPDKFISGQDIRIVSLSYNLLTEVHPRIFGYVPNLRYLGLDGNFIKQLSVNNFIPLWPLPYFESLNVSNNKLEYIYPGTFQKLKNLWVLELHRNNLKRIQPGVFHNLNKLLHLDLHENQIEHLTGNSLKNLPRLKELRLHSQSPPMVSIAYNAWENIGDNLIHLFIGNNSLTSFPHAVMENGFYPNLWNIYADKNAITNLTAYGREAYPEGQLHLHRRREKTFKPFSTYPNLDYLRLKHNYITHITGKDLCRMSNLRKINLADNNIHENNIDDDAFACIPTLEHIELYDNEIEVIPTCFSKASLAPSMHTLDIGYNYISYIAKGQLSNLRKLTTLKGWNNRVMTVENGAFPETMTHIELGDSEFDFLHEQPFANLPKLYHLSLQHNRITYLPLRAFENSPSLREIKLQNNHIPELRKQHFHGSIVNGLEFYIGYNDLGWIENGTFAGLDNMYYVAMYNNRLTRIPTGGSFSDVFVTESVSFESNWITVVPRDAFKNLVCEQINLRYNPIITIEPYAFHGHVGEKLLLEDMSFLRNVHQYSFYSMTLERFSLTGSRVTTIPANTFVDFNAKIMDLSWNEIEEIAPSAFYNVNVKIKLDLGNNRLTSLDYPIFDGYSRIQGMLDLGYNRLERIRPDALNNIDIVRFDATGNFLRDIPRVILTPKLEKLLFDQNQLSVLPTAATSDLTSLTMLRLAGNHLEYLEPGVLDNLKSVVTLDVSNNRLRTVPENLFRNMERLENLRLNNNQMTHLHKMHLHRELRLLDASENPLGTLDDNAFTELRGVKLNILLDQTDASLECSCGLVETVDAIAHRNISGTCGYSDSARGAVFARDQGVGNFYKSMPKEYFGCSASNVIVNVSSSTDISVSWDHPENAYYDKSHRQNQNPRDRRKLALPGITGKVVYNVTCSTPYAPDLVASVKTCIGAMEKCLQPIIKINATHAVNANTTGITTINGTDLSTDNVTSMANLTELSTDNVTSMTNPTDLSSNNVTSMIKDDTTTPATVYTTDIDSFTSSTEPTTNPTSVADVANVTSANDTEFVDVLQVNFSASHGVRPGTTYECSITLETNGNASARSSAVVVSTPDDIVPAVPSKDSNITGIELDVTYHDFSTRLKDFDNMEYIPYKNVTYVHNPYESWLAASATPENDMFSRWFRNDSSVNIEFKDTIFLEKITPTQLRFWSSDFFPLDGRGFRSEHQRDCLGTYHNFGFTSAIRTSFTFGGDEVISVGGGEGLWLFIDKVKVVELTSSGEAQMTCFVIDLSTASDPGGFVDVVSDTLYNGSCTIMKSKTSTTTLPLQLEVGMKYHFDLFHAETKTCSSELLLVLENWDLDQDQADDIDLPVDHTIDISEDAEAGDVVAAIDISDLFGGEHFVVTLHSGNEDRRFTIIDYEPQPSNKTTWIPEYSEIQDMEGNVHRYIECARNATVNTTSNVTTNATNTPVKCNPTSRGFSSNATITQNGTANVSSPNNTIANETNNVNNTELSSANTTITLNGTANVTSPNNTTTNETVNVNNTESSPCQRTVEEFSINATTMYIILLDELDYEVIRYYYLQMSVLDIDKQIEGFIAVRIKVTDVNDNCPVLTSIETFIPQPTLQKDPILTIDSVDIDSGRNGDIRYIVSAITADPPIEYNKHLDLWKDIYVNYTTLTIDVVAIDNGTIPRGTRTPLNITLRNSCVLDARYRPIDVLFIFNDTSHELTLRIPKYYMVSYDCVRLAGLSTGHIPDAWISASSVYDSYRTGSSRGRLHGKPKALGSLAGAWVAGSLDTDQYLQVDMRKPYRFRKVHIQGRADAEEWVTSFKIWYDAGNYTWVLYNDTDGNNTFNGSSDRSTVVVHTLDPVINAQRIRINPQTWHGNISLRAEFTGCSQDEQLYYDVNCMRCETSYYCLGDGERHTCGRCHDNSSTCDRDPTEHSFGLASECSPCPQGWSCVNGYASPCPMYHYTNCFNGTCAGQCIQCEPGYACNNGIRTICKPGTYSDGYKKLCASCNPGTYQDLYGQATCKPCGPGHSTANYGRISCYRCPREQYSVVTACRLCKNAAECPCLDLNSCFHRDLCYNKGSGDYGCFPCTAGYIGDGWTCTDIDECTEYDPCFQSRCINTDPGYQCLECPDGYTGTYEDAYSWVRHRRVFLYQNLERSNFSMQTCVDVDECAMDNGGCGIARTCVNIVGSFYCDSCEAGYLEFGGTECIWADFAASGNHGCSSNGLAIYTGPGRYKCECKIGYAGNGILCGLDTDNDGFPDKSLPCKELTCSTDNCPTIPNSMQENPDNDNLGNPCDDDDDGDRVPDDEDNCPTVYNRDQLDTDDDGYGDTCDTCPLLAGDQTDTDGDGLGNICDDDDDNDERSDAEDNCRLVANFWQHDQDGDGVGDRCDNCIWTWNADQHDWTSNWAGDACDDFWDYETDYDGDTVLNNFDNCHDAMNSDQIDSDGDRWGDACDHDMDNDGVDNEDDNCPWVPNPDQLDADRNTVGDQCQWDFDDDDVENEQDTCPTNRDISELSFKEHMVVETHLNFPYPKATFKVNGSEIRQTKSTFNPTLLIGRQRYGDIEYQGTWYVHNASAEDMFGCVFGYRDRSSYYAVHWTREHKTIQYEDEFRAISSLRGLHIKLVDFFNPDNLNSARAAWRSNGWGWDSKFLWHDPDMTPWKPETAYRWHVTFKPTIGYINLKVYQGSQLLVDSGPLYQAFLTGGRVGVFQWGEFPMTWSNLKVTCLAHQNQALYLNGIDGFVELDDVSTLGMDQSDQGFTVEVWVNLDKDATGRNPVFCSVDRDVCLWIQDGYVHAHYGHNTLVAAGQQLYAGIWYNLVWKFSLPEFALLIFINGNQQARADDVPLMNWSTITTNTTMFLGKRGTEYFRGTIDEFRLYNVSIPDHIIPKYNFLLTTKRQVRMRHCILYFRMEDSANLTSLVNSGLLSSPTATRHGGKFVPSNQQTVQHKLQYPTNYYENHGAWNYATG